MPMTPVVDAVDFVKQHAEIFVGVAAPSAQRVVGELVAEALAVVSGPVLARKVGDWWLVWCRDDWFREHARDLPRLFHSIIPFPEGGRNTSRKEVVLAAFASRVVTGLGSERQWVKGSTTSDPSLEHAVAEHGGNGRFIAFVW